MVVIPICATSRTYDSWSGPSVVLIDRDDLGLSDQDELAGARLLQTSTTDMGGTRASGYELIVKLWDEQRTSIVGVESVIFELDGSIRERETYTSTAAINAKEVEFRVDLNNNSVVGANIQNVLYDPNNNGAMVGSGVDSRRLYQSSNGIIVSNETLSTGNDLRNATVAAADGITNSIVLLRTDGGDSAYSIPADYSTVKAVAVNRDLTSNNNDSFTGYDIFLVNATGDVVVQSFDLNGIADGSTIALTGVDLAQAEIRTGRDISGNGVVGAALQSELFNPFNTNTAGNNSSRYAYQSNQGLIISRNGFDIGMAPAPDLRNVSSFSSWDGPGAILLTTDNNERFFLEPTETIVGVNMLREPGQMAQPWIPLMALISTSKIPTVDYALNILTRKDKTIPMMYSRLMPIIQHNFLLQRFIAALTSTRMASSVLISLMS